MGTEYAAEAKKKAPKPNTMSDDETDRLLGFGKLNGNDAVTIIKPPSTRAPRAYKPHTGGHRPMNTLSMSSTLPPRTQPHTPFTRQNETQHGPRKLALDVSRGFNVRTNEVEESDENFGVPQSVKRQKVVHPNSVSSISSESVDELPAESVRYGGRAGKSPATSQRRQFQDTSVDTQSRVGMASEFGGLEDMMNSRKVQPKKFSRLRNASSPLMKRSPKNRSVEVVSDDDQTMITNGSYGGHNTKLPRGQHLELPHHTGRGNERMSLTKSHSPYFPQNSGHSRATITDEQDLNKKFVASNGARRGNQDYLSSDELDGPATIGQHADVIPLSPDKRPSTVSPKKTATVAQSNGSTPEEQPVEPSIIKPTRFTSQTPSRTAVRHREDFDKDYLSGKRYPWSVPLTAVNLPGQELHLSSDMRLVLDKQELVYFIMEGDRPLRVAGSRLEMHTQGLQKIWWEEDGKRARFESSKRGATDHMLDLEFASEKDMSLTIKRLQAQSTNVKVSSEESEKVQKRFETRRKQQPMSLKPLICGYDNLDEGAQMAAMNQQRRQKQALADQQTSNTSRRRTPPMNTYARAKMDKKEPVKPPEKDPPRTKQSDRLDRDSVETADKPLGRPSLVSKSQPAHNDHLNLRRSTRASGLTRYLGMSPERHTSTAQKYSVEVGLGEKWSRPLSYPKVGKKKATVEWEDLQRLDDDEFLNDNLVSFYMRYLEQECTEKTPELAQTVYFFNSFFYDRLTTTQRGQKGINYEGVQRWTRGVDLFTYDHIIVPINELTHWYVAIICNLPALGRSDESSNEVSSPITAAHVEYESAAVVDADVAEDKTPEPQETQARESFAELSLDGKLHKRQPSDDSLMGHVNTKDTEALDVDEDHEMLDVPNAANKRMDLAKPSNVEKPDLIEDTDDDPKPSTSAKKQKRKSMPPSITKRDPTSPVIITFDSFGHPHSNVVKVLKQYLYEEGNAKKSKDFDVGKIKGITAKNIPQQSNFSDCGLYMLGYVEKFLEDRPKDFIGKIIKREYDDRKDWPKMVPSNMRKSLREQLQQLHEEDEADRIAMRKAKRASGSRDAESKPPIVEKDSTSVEEAASNDVPKDEKDTVSNPEVHQTEESLPLDVQQIRIARYPPPPPTRDEQSNAHPAPPNDPDVASVPSEPALDDSLVVLSSNDHASSNIKPSPPSPELPSSQPPQHPSAPQPPPRPASPSLPNEIDDSQPLSKPTPHPKADPEDLALSPPPHPPSPTPFPPEGAPPTLLEQLQTAANPPTARNPQNMDMVYSNWQPPQAPTNDNVNTPPLPPPHSANKRGVAQRVQPAAAKRQREQRRRGGERMKKEEAIVLDDD